MKSNSLRQQLQEAEDGLVSVRRELIKAHRELQDMAHDRDQQRKETLDLRRLLSDEVREKESIQASNLELRALVKTTESDNSRYRSISLPLFFHPHVPNQFPSCSTKAHFNSVALFNNVFHLFNLNFNIILIYNIKHETVEAPSNGLS